MSLHEERQQAAGYVSRVIKQRDEAFKLLERLEAEAGDVSADAAEESIRKILSATARTIRDFRTLIAKGK